jgi:hypothetical protein
LESKTEQRTGEMEWNGIAELKKGSEMGLILIRVGDGERGR